MQSMSTQTVTSILPTQPSEPTFRLVLGKRSEIPEGPTEKRPDIQPDTQPDIQPVIVRLRIIYLQHINCNDDLSLQIQIVAERFIRTDCSKIGQASDVIKIAQDCRNQFARVLCNDFDRAPLQEPVVVRGWKFEAWQLNDYISLDKFFGQRQVALSPFDQMPFPEELPKHEFANAIIELLKTIPECLQESNAPPLPVEQQAVGVARVNQFLIPFASQGAGDGKSNRQDVENFPPEKNLFVAWQRYEMWKKLAKASMQEKKCQSVITQLEIEIAARKMANENYLQQIISEEAQRLLAYFAARQQETEAHLHEAEQARAEIARLKEQLDEATSNLKKLRTDLTTQEKLSKDLQQQIYVEQAKYVKLAQEFQEVRNRCKRRPWWKFW